MTSTDPTGGVSAWTVAHVLPLQSDLGFPPGPGLSCPDISLCVATGLNDGTILVGRAVSIVQIGDSIGAGEGINYGYSYAPPTANGKWGGQVANPSWEGPYPNCHDSSSAYGNLVAESLDADFTQLACTGATYLNGITAPETSQGTPYPPAQLVDNGTYNPAYANADPNVVLVTFGADDVQFVPVVTSCIANPTYPTSETQRNPKPLAPVDCVPGNPGTVDQKDFIDYLSSGALQSHYAAVVNSIEAGAPDPENPPKIVFTDYANPFPPNGGTCTDTGAGHLIGLTSAQISFLSSQLNTLNTTIKATVTSLEASHPNVGFAEIAGAFAGHTWCTADPYDYGFTTLGSQAPFHPTTAGQKAIASLVLPALQSLGISGVTPTVTAVSSDPSGSPDGVTAPAGGNVSGTAGGFIPGETVEVTLHSTPVDLGSLTANNNGDVAFSVTVPAGTASGQHELDLTGETSARSAILPVFVPYPTAAPIFTVDTPPATVAAGSDYLYTFQTLGNPAATYWLDGDAPPWLSVDAFGDVLGTPPPGTTNFAYTVTASDGVSPNATSGPFTVTVIPPQPSPLEAVTPTRVCDSRAGNPSGLSGPAMQCDGQTIKAGTSLEVSVGGWFGVPADATAVVVNVTAVRPTGAGYLTVYPTGATLPVASNLNLTTGQVVANLVEVALNGGAISIYSSTTSDVVVDLQGYVAAAVPGASTYSPLSAPVRVCDTRPSNPSKLTGPAAQCSHGTLRAGGIKPIQIAGEFGVPVGATAVVANLTVVNPTSGGYLTAYPDQSVRPTASNVNYLSSQIVPNRALLRLGADGELDVYSSAATDIIIDISGYFTTTGGGANFQAETAPVRVCDTRRGDPSGLTGAAAQCDNHPLDPAGTLVVKVAGEFAVPPNASAVVINLTAVEPTAASYLTVYPGPTRPTTSDLNPSKGTVKPNLIVATVSPSGTITIYNNSGTTDVVIDLAGWYQ